MSQKPENVLQAELNILRKRLERLEAEHRELVGRAPGPRRTGLSRKLLFVALPGALLLGVGGGLYGQQAVDALLLNDKGATFSGRVGIRAEPSPDHGLTVKGSVKVNAESGNEAVLSFGPAQPTSAQLQLRYTHNPERIGFTDGSATWLIWSEYDTKNAYVGGNLGIGKEPTQAKLDVAGEVKATRFTTTGNVGSGTLNVTGMSTLKDTTVEGTLTVGKIAGAGMLTGAVFLRMNNTSKQVEDCKSYGTGQCFNDSNNNDFAGNTASTRVRNIMGGPCKGAKGFVLESGYCQTASDQQRYCMKWFCVTP